MTRPKTRHLTRHSTGMAPAFATAPLLLAAAMFVGCHSGEDQTPATSGRPDPAAQARALATYIIPPRDVQTLGYRIEWQADAQPIDDSGLKIVSLQDDAIFVLDGENFISRLRREDGHRLWRLGLGSPLDEVFGITYIPAMERVYVTNMGSISVLDAESGLIIGRQQLEKVANTAPAVYGEYVIYGTRDGQVIWHSHLVEYQWRGYQVAESILMTPLLAEDRIVAIGNEDASRSSRVMVLDPGSATQLWSKPLLDEVVSSPAVADGVVYIASTDQYLYAFDLTTGRTHWSRLTTSPLADPPVIIDDHLYQQIPGEGLTCFDAFPLDAPDGVVRWVCPEVTGTVIARNRERLLAWDAETHQLAVVSERRGALIETYSFPDLVDIRVTDAKSGHLLAYSEDGRIMRLTPR